MRRLSDSKLVENSELLVFNQDVSWLSFNLRVLNESTDERHPLLERLKFLAIAGANLDEFYRVKVSRIKNQRAEIPNHTNRTQFKEIYNQVIEATKNLFKQKDISFRALLDELKTQNVQLVVTQDDLNGINSGALSQAFEKIKPLLTPYVIDAVHPFHFIPNKSPGFIANVKMVRHNKNQMILVSVPNTLPRFIWLEDSKPTAISIDMLIYHHLNVIFPETTITDFGSFRYLRAADIPAQDTEVEDDAVLKEQFEKMLNQRRFGEGVQLILSAGLPKKIKQYLVNHLDIPPELSFESDLFIGYSDLFEVTGYDAPTLRYSAFQPLACPFITTKNINIFERLDKEELLIHHPYDSFDTVVMFLKSAAQDPQVKVIKQTLYRTGLNSTIVDALIECAQAGKTVIALIELKARFDEEVNLKWAKVMESAGIQVFYGVQGFKTHAKMTLILRQDKQGAVRPYVHIGTGNYNQNTARIYTDISYFTSNCEIGQDVISIFNGLTSNIAPKDLKQLILSPSMLRNKLYALINQEITNAKAGKPAQIWAKMNALVDPGIISKLYEASSAGVDIQLIVRGMCCLAPGVKGLSEHIQVKSIIGRFLEHSRIFCFANGAVLPSAQAEVYISSADWMPRNLDRRIEIMTPIQDPKLKSTLLNRIMLSNIKDTANSWTLGSDGRYTHSKLDGKKFSAHNFFLETLMEKSK
ncbi:MAG: polyphosphate kinase 1 [Alphaproteobacteria bacterium]|nr:polyphosphate kinase 1 [Alphaproteobacteria bacterium]